MRILDEKFRKNIIGDIFQCALAPISVFIVMMVLDVVTKAVIIAALGLSTFIAFIMPKAEVSKPRIMIGGYIVGIVAGCLCHYLSLWSLMTWVPFIHESPTRSVWYNGCRIGDICDGNYGYSASSRCRFGIGTHS